MENEQRLTEREENQIRISGLNEKTQAEEKPRTVHLSSVSFEDPLLDLYYDNNNGPPDLTASELDRLELNNRCGMHVVYEVLRNPPVEYVSYQRLSRCATKLAVKQMERMHIFEDLEQAWTEYGWAKRRHSQRVRKFFDEFIEVNSKGYQPFVKKANVHLWFWDEETKHRALKLLWKAQLPSSLFYAFIASILTLLPDLEKQYDDLLDEYKMGMVFARRLLAVVECARQACTEW